MKDIPGRFFPMAGKWTAQIVRKYSCQHSIGLKPANVRMLVHRQVSDSPLTVRETRMQFKKTYKDPKVREEVERFDMMHPIDISEMPRIHQGYVRLIDKENKRRITDYYIDNYRTLYFIWALMLLVVSIYQYGCWAIGRETFLEEIDEEVALERGELEYDELGNLKPKEN